MEKIFNMVVKIISDRTGIDGNDLIYSKKQDHVDARSILVSLLSNLGFSDTLTATYLHITRQGVNKLKNTLDNRKKHSYILATYYKQCSNDMATNNLNSNP
jgi:hypothetical protein